MKILHTSDWHLGQAFFGYERAEEHRLFLSWLNDVIREQGVDLLLVAGDIFDSPNPSAESQKIYYNFIKETTTQNRNLQIIITAGNHDSAARLEAPAPLFDEFNVSVRGVVQRTADGVIDYERHIIPIKEGGCCLAVPYLRQGDCPATESFADGVKEFYTELYNIAKTKYSGAIIAMGHLQATGSEISTDDRSERTTIGALDLVSPDFSSAGIAYTALGHLHKAQRVSKRENMRYSGSPLPMSFAERNNKQSVTIVTIQGTEVDIEKIPFDAPIKLITVPAKAKPIEQVIEEIEQLPQGEVSSCSPFLEVQVLSEGPDPTRRQQIEKALEGRAVRLARIVAVSAWQENNAAPLLSYDDFKKIEPLELAKIVYRQKYDNCDMPADIEEMLAKVIKEVER